MKVRTRNQGGSLVSYAVVGVILAVLLIGGLYFVQRYNDTVQKSNEVAKETEKNDDKKASDSSADSSNTESSDTANQSNSATTNDTDDEDTTFTETDETAESEASSSLPATGPESTVSQLLGLSALTFAGVAYVRSRRTSLDL